MIEAILIVSVSVNILFILYSRWLISILKAREEDVNDLADNVAEYVGHVTAVHEMEMFYGDQTLQSLISHGTQLVEKIEGLDFLLSEADSEEVEEEQSV